MMKKGIIVFLVLPLMLVAQSSVLSQFSNTFADVAEKANPAVVTIMTDRVYKLNDLHSNVPFQGFPFVPNMPDREYHGQALGSGVIVDQDKGYILTNNHVIEDADAIKIKLIDKRVVDATIVGTDPKSDLAVVQVKADDLHELPLGDSDQLRVGEWVLAVGSPFSENLSHTVTAGIVSALGRSNIMSGNNYEDFIQTDAAINPGNSGGALLNLKGELIGINTAIATGGYEKANRGVGFAIPSNMARKVMNDLIDKGYVVRSWLGVYIQEVDEKVARAMDLNTRNGALVGNVVENSPAEKAGLEEGDVIIKFNGVDIDGPAHLKNVVSSTPPGEVAPVTILRNGRSKTVKVKLEELKDETVAMDRGSSRSEFGLTVADVSRSVANRFGVDSNESGVVVTDVAQGSAGDQAGIRPGDLITRVGTEKVKSKKDFLGLVKDQKKKDTLLLLVKRDNISRFYALEIEE
ncbi:MAG: Do family serine endopeptidase [FCB group bacterium]|nr:Do family serine endopeptidase [FCB group bacterium]